MSVLSCPVCQGTMREIDRDGITIDTCTQCRGVWLDRGELEKLATRLTHTGRERDRDEEPRGERFGFDRDRRRHRDFDDDDVYDDDRRHGRGTHKKSTMSRLMDFFD